MIPRITEKELNCTPEIQCADSAHLTAYSFVEVLFLLNYIRTIVVSRLQSQNLCLEVYLRAHVIEIMTFLQLYFGICCLMCSVGKLGHLNIFLEQRQIDMLDSENLTLDS